MKLLKNQGTDRVIDELRASLTAGGRLDAASPDLSLFAYGELREVLRRLSSSRLIVPLPQADAQSLLGSDADRGSRNQLSSHKLARDLAEWLRKSVEVKAAPGPLPQATLVTKNADGTPAKVISGNCPLTTDGLGITPANQFSLVQATETRLLLHRLPSRPPPISSASCRPPRPRRNRSFLLVGSRKCGMPCQLPPTAKPRCWHNSTHQCPQAAGKRRAFLCPDSSNASLPTWRTPSPRSKRTRKPWRKSRLRTWTSTTPTVFPFQKNHT